MTQMIRSGEQLFPAPNTSSFEHLKPGFYKVGKTITGQYFLTEDVSPKIPSKIYGKSHTNRADRIIGAFNRNTRSSTGVLLVGDAGSGKTLLASDIMIREAKNRPVITVDNLFYGSAFNEFIHNFDSAVVFIDEIEKLYDFSESEILASLLSLFSGSVTSHKLFICTANNKYAIGEHFFNRTSRFRYVCKFDRLDETAITEYLTDNLDYPELSDQVRDFVMSNPRINMDVLATLVEEVNIIGNLTDAINDLNIEQKIEGEYKIISVNSEDNKKWECPYPHVDTYGGGMTIYPENDADKTHSDHATAIYVQKSKMPRFTSGGLVIFDAEDRTNKNKFTITAIPENPAF